MKQRKMLMAIIVTGLLVFIAVFPCFANKNSAPPPKPEPTKSISVKDNITVNMNLKNNFENAIIETGEAPSRFSAIFDYWCDKYRLCEKSLLEKILLFSGIGLAAIVFICLMIVIIYFFLRGVSLIFISRPWYIPKVIVSVSIDGGKTYDENVRHIEYPDIDVVYVKFEIEIKTHEILAGKIIHYNISCRKHNIKNIYLNDYTGKKISKTKLRSKVFSVIASNRPKRVVTMYRCMSNKLCSTMLYQFHIAFKRPVKKNIYSQTIRFCFAPYSKKAEKNPPSTKAINGKIDISVVTDKKQSGE